MLNRLDVLNFRSLKNFHVEKLGQVNLIVGKNNSGKSSVLESIRIFAGNAQRQLMEDIARSHDEPYRLVKELSTQDESLPFSGFFSRDSINKSPSPMILIGDSLHRDQYITLEQIILQEFREKINEGTEDEATVIRRRRVEGPVDYLNPDVVLRKSLAISKGDKVHYIVYDHVGRGNSSLDVLPVEKCSIVPTRYVSVEELAREWDGIVFTDNEELTIKALQHVSPELQGIVFVEAEDDYTARAGIRSSRREIRRVPKVKMSQVAGSIPMASLGDGVFRIFQLAMKAFSAREGFLLIDEFENGLHYGIQEKIWQFIFEIATKLNIQVFATTHSWDCVSSFANVSLRNQSCEGVLFRVGRSARRSDEGSAIATLFSKEELSEVTQAVLEIR